MSKYFKLEELVRPEIFKKYGNFCYNFIDDRLLATLDVLREVVFDAPITINTRRLKERGLRDNKSHIVQKKKGLYLSAHCFGKAVDFNVKGLDAKTSRDIIFEKSDRLPYKVRLERKFRGFETTWVHIDLFTYNQNEKVYFFDVD